MSSITRRGFLAWTAAAALLAACERLPGGSRVGLALGGGGARGLAHVPMFEALDDLGIKPYRIAGTSIGAVFGALYASGMSGLEIRRLVDRFIVTGQESWMDAVFEKQPFKWLDFLDPELGGGGLLDTDGFIRFLGEVMARDRFADLEVPLMVVAADLWTGEQVVFRSGPLLPAIKASIALPGLFQPVRHGNRVLVDGGTVNPVPYDLLLDDCDVTVAIDVSGVPDTDGGKSPSYAETVFHSIHNMANTILEHKLAARPPDVLIRPEIRGIRVLEFYRADEIYRAALPGKQRLLQQLRVRVKQRRG